MMSIERNEVNKNQSANPIKNFMEENSATTFHDAPTSEDR